VKLSPDYSACDKNSELAIQRWRCFALFQIQRG